ncbi:MAG: glycerophosphodiester phosphodiesterase family protein [Pseudomonadota bacterium]
MPTRFQTPTRFSGRIADKGAIIAAFLAVLSACQDPKAGNMRDPSARSIAGEKTETNGPWPTLNGERPIVIAHRGASGDRPEHTLAAYDLAIDQGADAIEPDLVLTKDGVLVARHDRYLSTTTNVADVPAFAERKKADADPNGNGRVDWWVEDFTLAEIKTLKARQPRQGRSKEFDDQFFIPTFAEILDLATDRARETGRAIAVYPETKSPGYFEAIGLAFDPPLLDAISEYDAGKVYLQSFEPPILKRLKDKTDATLVQLVFMYPNGEPNIPLAEIAGFADAVGPQKTLLFGKTASGPAPTTFVRDAHALGLAVHPWTFRDDDADAAFADNSPSQAETDAEDPSLASGARPDRSAIDVELEAYFQAGVDGLFADFPATAIKARRRFNEALEINER